MKKLDNRLDLILKLIDWKLLIGVIFIFLLLKLYYFSEIISSLIITVVFLIQTVIIWITIINKKKAFWYIANISILFFNLSVGFYSWYYLAEGKFAFMIIGGIISFIIGYISSKRKKGVFIERAVEVGKLNINKKRININNTKWPNMSTSKIKDKIDEFIFKFAVPLGVLLRMRGVLDGYESLMYLIGGLMFLFTTGEFFWRTKWILDWQKECGCTITTEFADIEE